MRLPDFLERIAAEEQLFVKHRRKINGDQLDPRKAVAGDVMKPRGEQHQSVRGTDEQDGGCASDEKLTSGDTRRDEEPEVPLAVFEDRHRAERRRADAEQRDPLVEKGAGELRYESPDEECRQVKRHEEAERGDDLRECADVLLRLDACLLSS